ncbi:MAG: Crp/Fnr family transcriptional regulator [Flavobacteriales bacterium]|nr:Crp/Fnr family transcriptional regulator [Flavobacteriales bacterium]
MRDILTILNSDSNSSKKTFKKGAFVQKADDSIAGSVYITKGILRSYIIDSSGKEHIYAFASEKHFIGDLEAMEFNQSSQLYIDCLEDSEVIIFNQEKLLNNLSKEEVIEFNELLRRNIGKLQRRILMLIGSPAVDRYLYFVDTYPNLINRLPQRMIASYLGIAPQTLSTLRRKILQSE